MTKFKKNESRQKWLFEELGEYEYFVFFGQLHIKLPSLFSKEGFEYNALNIENQELTSFNYDNEVVTAEVNLVEFTY